MQSYLRKNEERENIKIIEINYGIACRISNRIYINKKLKEYPNLYYSILTHEYEHSSSFTKKDFLMDLINVNLKGLKIQYYKFIIKHPSSWLEFLPACLYEGKLIFAPMTTLFWGIGLIIFGLIGGFVL
jgi:hypothetical protein